MSSLLNKVRCYIRTKWEWLMSHFHDSETRFIAWVTSLSGLIVAGIGAVDPTLIFNDALSPKQQISIGLSFFAKGVLDYVMRSFRDEKPNA